VKRDSHRVTALDECQRRTTCRVRKEWNANESTKPFSRICARFDSRESISCPNAKTADRHYAGPNARRVGQRPWRVGVPAKLILGECDSVFKCGRYSRREV